MIRSTIGIMIFLLALFSFSACDDGGGDSLATDGDTTDGDKVDGDSDDGDADDGEADDGDAEDGDVEDGDTTDGDATEPVRPLARSTTVLSEVAEVAWLLPGAEADYTGIVFDDKGAETPDAEIGQITNPMLTDLPNGRLVSAKYGDIDGDNKLELVVLSVFTETKTRDFDFDMPQVTIFDDADAGMSTLAAIEPGAFDLSALNADNESIIRADLAVGNIDDDEADEIVICGTYGSIKRVENYNGVNVTASQNSSLIWSFDDAAASFALMHTNTETGNNTHDMRIDLAELDNDDREEIIVTGVDGGWSKAWALDDHIQGYEQLKRWHKMDDVFGENIYNPNLATGDFDGDGIDEVVFGSYKYGSCRFQTRVYDDALAEFAYMEGKQFQDCPNVQYNTHATPILEAGDIDGNGRDDVVVGMHDAYASGQDRGWDLFYFRPDRDDSGPIDRTATDTDWDMGYDSLDPNPSRFFVLLADTNRDMKDEVLTIHTKGELNNSDPWNPNQGEKQYTYIGRRYELGGDGFEKVEEKSWPAPGNNQAIVAPGDIDADSMVVRFTGKVTEAISNPRVVVAMAMPPCWGGDIPQDNGANTWVGYGQVREVSESEGNEISVSASVTLSVEAGDPFGIVEAEAKTTLSQELTKTNTNTKSLSTGTKRQAGWSDTEPDNFVIYTATEYRRFEYEIVSNEDPAEIGKHFTIDVPVQTNTFKKTAAAYNELAPEELQIGEETFSHTPGDPSSYKTTAERDALLEQYTGWYAPASGKPLEPVGETSAGGNEIFISMSEENETAEQRTIGVEVSAGFKVGGVGTEASVGVSQGSIYSISISEATEYAGSVGDIPSSHYAEYGYNFGIFVYNFDRSDIMKYQVIDWVVEQP